MQALPYLRCDVQGVTRFLAYACSWRACRPCPRKATALLLCARYIFWTKAAASSTSHSMSGLQPDLHCSGKRRHLWHARAPRWITSVRSQPPRLSSSRRRPMWGSPRTSMMSRCSTASLSDAVGSVPNGGRMCGLAAVSCGAALQPLAVMLSKWFPSLPVPFIGQTFSCFQSSCKRWQMDCAQQRHTRLGLRGSGCHRLCNLAVTGSAHGL